MANNAINNQTSQSDIKNKICDILNIENSSAWDIIDSDIDAGLYLVHYNNQADPIKYGNIRGIVVDVNNRIVISKSYKYTPTVIKSELTLDEDNKLTLVDTDGFIHPIDLDTCKFQTGFEGAIIRVYKHAGKVYFGTRKRLNFNKSKWGSQKTFEDMYNYLCGPKAEELFDSQCSYSPYCHVFIMAHPDLLVASKDNFDDGYLVYLGSEKMWDNDGTVFNIEMVESEPKVVKVTEQKRSIADEIPRGTIYSPRYLTLEEVNKHLKTGYFEIEENIVKLSDPRLLPGEFIIIYLNDKFIKVESIGYAWRCDMRNNTPNLYCRFFQLVNSSYIDTMTIEGRKSYDNLFPSVAPGKYSDIKDYIQSVGPIPYMIGIKDLVFPNAISRLNNIWMCYLISVPLHRQSEVVEYLNRFYLERTQLIGWLKNMSTNIDVESLTISPRAKNIILAAKKYVYKNPNVKGRDKYKNINSFGKSVKDNIRNFIYKEDGPSLYRLIRDMKKWNKEQIKQEMKQIN